MIVDKHITWLTNQFNWRANKQGYMVTTMGHQTIKLHRLLLMVGPYELVDHINGNRLDNRFSNLRVVTPQQNCMNRYAPKGVSGVKGVSRDHVRGKWKASIKHSGVHTTIGRYPTIAEAALAYRNKEVELFKQYARRK